MRPLTAILCLVALTTTTNGAEWPVRDVRALPNSVYQRVRGHHSAYRNPSNSSVISTVISTSSSASTPPSTIGFTSTNSTSLQTSIPAHLNTTMPQSGNHSRHSFTQFQNTTANKPSTLSISPHYINSTSIRPSLTSPNSFRTSIMIDTTTLTIIECPETVTDCPGPREKTYTTVATLTYTTVISVTTLTKHSTETITMTKCSGSKTSCALTEQLTYVTTAEQTFTTVVPCITPRVSSSVEHDTATLQTTVTTLEATKFVTYTTTVPVVSIAASSSGEEAISSALTRSISITETSSVAHLTKTITDYCTEDKCAPVAVSSYMYTTTAALETTVYVTEISTILVTSTIISSGGTLRSTIPSVSTVVSPSTGTVYVTKTITEICSQGECSPLTSTNAVNSGTRVLMSTAVTTATSLITHTYTITVPHTSTYLSGASVAFSTYATVSTTTWIQPTTVTTTIIIFGTSTISVVSSAASESNSGWAAFTSYTYPSGFMVPTSFNVAPTILPDSRTDSATLSPSSKSNTVSIILTSYLYSAGVPTSSSVDTVSMTSLKADSSNAGSTTPANANSTPSSVADTTTSRNTDATISSDAGIITITNSNSNVTSTISSQYVSITGWGAYTSSGSSSSVTSPTSLDINPTGAPFSGFSTRTPISGQRNITRTLTTSSQNGSMPYTTATATYLSTNGSTSNSSATRVFSTYSCLNITTGNMSTSTVSATFPSANTSSAVNSTATLTATWPRWTTAPYPNITISSFNVTGVTSRQHMTNPTSIVSASSYAHSNSSRIVSSNGTTSTSAQSSTSTSKTCTATPTPQFTSICSRTMIEGCTPCLGQGVGPWCGLDLNTDYYTEWPSTCALVHCQIELFNTTMAPDGVERLVLSVNDQFPGPLIEAQWGDTVQVDVTNWFQDNGTSIHFHGVRQWHTNEMDGVASITQCPIAGNGGTMTYTWVATQYGHSWYHSHYSVQAWEGVQGPMIIHGPTTAEFDIDLGPVMLTDWLHTPAFTIYESVEHTTQPDMDNILINGKNVWGTEGSYIGERAEFVFTPGKKHRMQLVMTALDSTFAFSIDHHTFTVIGMDWTPIVPYETDVLKITIGQRYDIIVEANQNISDYWMRVDPMTYSVDPGVVFGCGATNVMAGDTRAIVHYEGSCSTPNTTAYGHDNTCNDEPYDRLVPWLSINAGVNGGTIAEAITLAQNASTSIYRWYLSGSTFLVSYEQPTLLSLFEGNETINGPLALELPTVNEWVYVIIETPVPLSHPIHMHGHDLYLLGSGNFSTYSNQPLNLINPPRRDVVNMPSKGWLVIGFITDNPGAWLLHCHIGWHLSMGFALQIIERRSEALSEFTDDSLTSNCASWNEYSRMASINQIDSGA